ncbi:hypothetical protein AOG23_08885 [Rhizobium acidisoli]|nr:hypothetical protein AOG23_08885 [Rhizobium acidisoli]
MELGSAGGSWTLLEVFGFVIAPLLIICGTLLLLTWRVRISELRFRGSINRVGSVDLVLKTEKAPKRGLIPIKRLKGFFRLLHDPTQI